MNNVKTFCQQCEDLRAGKCSGYGHKKALCETSAEVFCKSWEATCEPFRRLLAKRRRK